LSQLGAAHAGIRWFFCDSSIDAFCSVGRVRRHAAIRPTEFTENRLPKILKLVLPKHYKFVILAFSQRKSPMKKKSLSQSAFFNLRFLTGVVLSLFGICLVVAALAQYTHASSQSKQRAPHLAAPATDDAIQYSPADKEGRFVYLIEFAEKGMLHRQTRARGERFNANTTQAQADRAQVMTEQANHVQGMGRALGRDLNVTHHFLVTRSGVATHLTPEEAQTLRGLRASSRWNANVCIASRPLAVRNSLAPIKFGTARPCHQAAPAQKAEGIIIAMLDTGIDSAHPSFANDPTCGHGSTQPNKLISALDCSSTAANGLCNARIH
jgi:hypothetical protein